MLCPESEISHKHVNYLSFALKSLIYHILYIMMFDMTHATIDLISRMSTKKYKIGTDKNDKFKLTYRTNI